MRSRRSAARSLDRTARARPEYEQFSAARERLALQEQLASRAGKPRVSAFGRVGYGRPGLNALSSELRSILARPASRCSGRRGIGERRPDREVLEIQREIVVTNEARSRESLHRGIQQSIATIARLDSTLALDDRIVALRERIDTETRAKLREGVVTAAEYADRSSDVLTARLARIQHRVQLAQARANL